MKILIYSSKNFEEKYLLEANEEKNELKFTSESLGESSAALAKGFDAVCIFAGDDASTKVIEKLHKSGVKYIAIRAAGYDNVHVEKANHLGMKVANVPDYSPNAIAEHAVALMLVLNRKLIVANEQVHQQNFTLGNLIGFDLHGKTVGIIGSGKIGSVVAKILHGFGCHLLGFDIRESADLTEKYGLKYVDLATLCRLSDIITIHTCLTEQTKYLINMKMIEQMKKGVMVINTSRGAVINTADVISGLEGGRIGFLGLDVYEKESGIFFYDHSKNKVEDKILLKLLSFQNVLITPHQAFATTDALRNIAQTTFYNIGCWEQNRHSKNELPNRGLKDEHFVHSHYPDHTTLTA